jgi:hypothetical protein
LAHKNPIIAGKATLASCRVALPNQTKIKAVIKIMPAIMVVLGFWVILFNIFAPLVNGVTDCKAERKNAYDRHNLRS